MKVGLILETGEAREVHHMCVLLGYGADAICPYLVFETARQLRREGVIDAGLTDDKIFEVGYSWHGTSTIDISYKNPKSGSLVVFDLQLFQRFLT